MLEGIKDFQFDVSVLTVDKVELWRNGKVVTSSCPRNRAIELVNQRKAIIVNEQAIADINNP